MSGNPYDFDRMTENAVLGVIASRHPDTVTGFHEVVIDGKKVTVDTSKSQGSFKTYSMEEAKSLEIVPFDDSNPFGEMTQNFTDHLAEMVAASDAISAEKEKLARSVVLTGSTDFKYTVKDLVKSLKDKSSGSIPIPKTFPQCLPILEPHPPEHQKSDE